MPSLVQAHDRVKSVEWTPSYVEHQPRYPTRYKVPKKTKDPFRTLVREYLTMDERRHLNQQMYLLRYFAKNAADPCGFDRGMKVRGDNIFARAGRVCFDNFYVNDPIECALSLQVVGETAYTNPLFVALTAVAALNGDHATPGVFLSIQSDEARHMANGYSTLAAVLCEPDNLPMLQQDFDRSLWRQ